MLSCAILITQKELWQKLRMINNVRAEISLLGRYLSSLTLPSSHRGFNVEHQYSWYAKCLQSVWEVARLALGSVSVQIRLSSPPWWRALGFNPPCAGSGCDSCGDTAATPARPRRAHFKALHRCRCRDMGELRSKHTCGFWWSRFLFCFFLLFFF